MHAARAAFSNAATPGNCLPIKKSINAPPAVLTYEILLISLSSCNAAIVWPPPAREKAFEFAIS